MGTRGIIGVAIDGEPKVTYNHFDSYPSGVGLNFLAACREFAAQPPGALLKAIDNLQVVDEDSTPITMEAIVALEPYTNTDVGQSFKDGKIDESLNWYQLTRGLQGNIKETLAAGYMVDAGSFPIDSLFCEWGYVLNLGGEEPRLEVYEGWQKERPTEGLWAGRPTRAELEEDLSFAVSQRGEDAWTATLRQEIETDSGYKAIKLVAAWPLSELPTDEEFLARFESGEEVD